ncbi:MAG: ribosome small subunit-dependent GTPase A [Chloroflexi bacterium]|nr:ribosome small subunit-dependent GTPase A [Chloroflexota bacterium]
MNLSHLGFSSWFQAQSPEPPNPECRIARVSAVNKNSYLLRNETCEVFAELSGSLEYFANSSLDIPTVGDWVFAQYHNDDTFAVIHGLLPRKSMLRRKTPFKKVDFQLIAANIDTALIIQACDFDFNLRRLERYLVMVNEGGIEPLLLLTKSDLVSPETVRQRIGEVNEANLHSRVIPVSNLTGEGLGQVRQLLQPAKTYCLLGSSGVGKSTLINNLVGCDQFETNLVREKDGKGRHTTTRRQLIILDEGAILIDTPGIRELANIGAEQGIGEVFADLQELSQKCRFSDCTHTRENGCALLEAVSRGEVSEERYHSYLKLLKESEVYEMSYLERRQKDREFGKRVKQVMKHYKKK